MRHALAILLLLSVSSVASAQPGPGNRLAYLDEVDPYYPHKSFPKLITPQWVGEASVDAVVILAIDDMRDPKKYEAFLRPILRRLKEIDGRAPVSIMTNQVDPQDPQLQTWLKEGLSLECHTLDHPCPFFKDGFAKAKATYDKCVDLMYEIPNNKPVAFRMPCCDSLNTPSPRFFAEIFNKTTDKGKYLSIDSSVFNVFTANDPELPRDLVNLPNGSERFRRYLPADRSFVNTIEDYPYPYVIGRLCWQFPCATPSDWQAQHLHKPNNPQTVTDWKANLDCTVIKKGVMTMVFHPHGWIKNDQLVELVDYADKKYGKRVKFLNFREALARLEKNLLKELALRYQGPTGADYQRIVDSGIRLLDVNKDGYLDVIFGGGRVYAGPDKGLNRIWSPATSTWSDIPLPPLFFPWLHTKEKGYWSAQCQDTYGVLDKSGLPTLYVAAFGVVPGDQGSFWKFDGKAWNKVPALTAIDKDWLKKQGIDEPFSRDCTVLLRDIAGSGLCELLYCQGKTKAVLRWSEDDKSWKPLPFSLPASELADNLVHAASARLVDIDGDGKLDIVFANEKEYGVYLFKDMKEGWSRKVVAGKAGDPGAIPVIGNDKNGWIENMGFFVHSDSLCWANEGTTLLKGLITRIPFQDLLKEMEVAPMSPEASLKAMRPRPGFQVELMAAEPLVKSPIAFNWGPDGRLWVVEMGDYPLGEDGKGSPGGRIKILEDTKGTGKFDKATLFMDGLHYPTAVLPWKKGALIVAAPEIFYAEDTTGSGKADKKEVIFTGFTRGNPQHLVNSLVYGLDNWIYCANGDSGGEVMSVKTGKKVNIRGRDFRFKPDTGEIELQSGQTQYGRSRDDWGNWFGNNNSQPMYHYVLDEHYLSMNKALAAPDPRVMVPVISGNAPVYPVARILPRFNDPHTAGRFTSACSAIIYRDNLFGPAFAGNMFVSEPVHNLVHREIVKPKGLSFTSYRAADEQQSEFLASMDNWFRPTTIQTGPDGALWIADMYRFVIEHPQWIPKDWQAKLNLRAGEDKGRLYRVLPVDKKPRAFKRLDKMSTEELVACLESPNGWTRDMAQLLLIQRNDKTAAPMLVRLFRQSDNPLARLHALWTLGGMDRLALDEIALGLGDKHPGVRRSAIRLLESNVAAGDKLPAAWLKLDRDPDPQVRQQLAYTLGLWGDLPQAAHMLATIALDAGDDPYMLASVFTSVSKDHFADFAEEVALAAKAPDSLLMTQVVKLAVAYGSNEGLAAMLNAISSPRDGQFTRAQLVALAGILDGLDDGKSSLKKWHDEAPNFLHGQILLARPMIAAGRKLAVDGKASLPDRAVALRLLGRDFDRQEEDRKTLAALLGPQNPAELQLAAAAALARLHTKDVPELLLSGWKSHGPALRAQILDSLLSRPEWVGPTLVALEKKTILPAEVDAIRRQRLLDSKVDEVRQRAAKIFAAASNVDRQKLVENYRPALAIKGDAAKGTEIFKKNCAACHQLGGIGQVVGPDLAPEVNRPGEVLLIAILDPNQAVEARYISYLATTKNGQQVTGILASETGSSITLIAADGKKHEIARSDLDDLTSTGKSLMPEGLEKDIAVADMADLIAFLRKHATPAKRKAFEGNTPAVVTANADGALTLLPSACEIYGKTLVLEGQFGNLGFWQSADDKALWTVEVPKAGKYQVWLDWACDPSSTGNTLALDAGEKQLLTYRVESTGSWEKYRYARVGEVTLEAGRQSIVVRAQGPLTGALIDLKGIKLVPK
jgi:putative membrane-bound dehydrogenase-like protein